MKIGIASDHAGFALKMKLIEKFPSIDFVDYGTYSEESCDYPDFAHALGAAISSGELAQGVAICGSGNGIQISVNKHKGVRAGLCWEPEIAKLVRQHNDANVCAIPARFVTETEAVEILKIFLDTDFEAGRHARRVNKIDL